MAVRFDASGDKLTATANLPSSSRGLTICGWFYVSVDRDDWSTLFNISASTSNYIYIQTNTTGVDFRLWSADAPGETALFTATVGVWYFVALTVSSAGTAKAYWGTLGSALSTATHGATIFSWTPTLLSFGDSVWTGEWLNGRAFAYKVWTAELTQADLEQEMQSILPKYTANLNRWLPVFPGSGERARDYSGNGYNMTEGGTLTDEDHPPISWGAQPIIFPRAGTTAYTLTCEAGSYAITGNAQNLLWKHLLTPDVGNYAITGNAVGLAHGYPMAITTGSYVITGNDQSLLWKHLISLTSGSYAITGNDTGLYRGYPITIASGNYAITGNDQGLLWKHLLAVTAGDYAITGNDVGLLWKHVLSLASGSYAITGNDVNLVYTPLGTYTIICAAGTYAITGNAVTFARTYILLIASGLYSITGYTVDLSYATGQEAVSAGYSKFPPHYRRIIEEPFPADDPEALLIWWWLVNRG